MRRPGQALSRLQLLEHAWDFAYENRSNVIDVYVRYLREKIDRPFGASSLETVRGVGYRLREDGDVSRASDPAAADARLHGGDGGRAGGDGDLRLLTRRLGPRATRSTGSCALAPRICPRSSSETDPSSAPAARSSSTGRHSPSCSAPDGRVLDATPTIGTFRAAQRRRARSRQRRPDLRRPFFGSRARRARADARRAARLDGAACSS